jgi:hypothetical protein
VFFLSLFLAIFSYKKQQAWHWVAVGLLTDFSLRFYAGAGISPLGSLAQLVAAGMDLVLPRMGVKTAPVWGAGVLLALLLAARALPPSPGFYVAACAAKCCINQPACRSCTPRLPRTFRAATPARRPAQAVCRVCGRRVLSHHRRAAVCPRLAGKRQRQRQVKLAQWAAASKGSFAIHHRSLPPPASLVLTVIRLLNAAWCCRNCQCRLQPRWLPSSPFSPAWRPSSTSVPVREHP